MRQVQRLGERLLPRELEPGDVDAVYAIYGDPLVDVSSSSAEKVHVGARSPGAVRDRRPSLTPPKASHPPRSGGTRGT